jgi:hypothetical protein
MQFPRQGNWGIGRTLLNSKLFVKRGLRTQHFPSKKTAFHPLYDACCMCPRVPQSKPDNAPPWILRFARNDNRIYTVTLGLASQRRSIQKHVRAAWPSRLMRMTLCRDGCGWAHASGTSCRVCVVLKLDPRLWGVVDQSTTRRCTATENLRPRNRWLCAQGSFNRRG